MDVSKSRITLFAGGLLPRLLRRMGVRDAAFNRVRVLSILGVPLIAWLPLIALTAIGGTFLIGSVNTPFLTDLNAHIRLLIATPLLLVAGFVAEARIGPTIDQFVSRFLIPDEMLEKFEEALASALRLGDSVVADIVILVLIFGTDLALAWKASAALESSAWFASQGKGLTLAGMWYAYVSLPIFEFVLLRWYFRLFIWARFLRRVSKLKLRLVPAHPDRVGGLGFLLLATQALAAFAMAHGALLAGWIGTRVLFRGEKLPDFKGEIAVVVVFVLCITIAPLLAFTRPLILAKRRGVLEYGALASRYVYDFETKWMRPKGASDEVLVGSADIQSLADMGGSYELVRTMRSLPITTETIVTFVVATLLPVSPLLLTIMPLGELIKKLVGILF